MSLIDFTYFDGPLLLAVSSDALEAAAEAAISSYEDEYLRKALGPSLYAAFIAGIAAADGGFSDMFSDMFAHSELEDRWKWIRDGHSWTYNGKTRIWTGLINTKKQSPIADYVYWQYRANNYTRTTQLGEVFPNSENATPASPMRKMVRAWNDMVDRTRELGLMCAYLNAGATYPEFQRCEVYTEVYEFQNVIGI